MLSPEGVFKDGVFRTRTFPDFLERAFPIPEGLLEHQLRLEENTGHVCLDPVQESPRLFLFLAKRFTYWRNDTLVAMPKARSFGRKNDQLKSSKNIFFYFERNTQSQVRADLQRNRHCRAPAPGSPQSRYLRVELSSGVAVRSLVSICPVICLTLFFYLIFVSLSLCSVIYLIFEDFYAGLFFSALFVYFIFMYKKKILDICVRSMLYVYTSKELCIFCSSKVVDCCC